MPDDADARSDLGFQDRCVDACRRRWDRAIEAFGVTRVLLVLAGMLLVLVLIGWRLLTAAFDVYLATVIGVAFPLFVFGLLVLSEGLLTARATAATSPHKPIAANTSAHTDAPRSSAGATGEKPVSSRTWLRSWPWQTFLRSDRIEVGRILRPPVVIPLERVARITLSFDDYQVLTLMDGAGETIGQVGQNDFAGEFLAALADITGREIEYLPFSGRPRVGGGGASW